MMKLKDKDQNPASAGLWGQEDGDGGRRICEYIYDKDSVFLSPVLFRMAGLAHSPTRGLHVLRTR